MFPLTQKDNHFVTLKVFLTQEGGENISTHTNDTERACSVAVTNPEGLASGAHHLPPPLGDRLGRCPEERRAGQYQHPRSRSVGIRKPSQGPASERTAASSLVIYFASVSLPFLSDNKICNFSSSKFLQWMAVGKGGGRKGLAEGLLRANSWTAPREAESRGSLRC